MDISSINSSVSTTTAATSSGTSAKELENQFLSLLVAQLKNQDPTNPMENQDFVSELAQLQALDQQQKLTVTNQSLLLQSSLATGASIIGTSVTGNVTDTEGSLVEITGVVQSLKIENGNVIYQVQTESGLVSMSPSGLKTVSVPGFNA
jgi:flagellar basal-body rod modification protein FlgD